MKNAYLISAHAYYDQLLNLIKLLDSENNDIYIHINAKSVAPNYDEILRISCKSRIAFVPRVPIEWGNEGFLQAQLILLEEAYKQKTYDYYHMLSVSDLPIKSNHQIDDFLEKNKYNNKNREKYTNYINISILKEPKRRSYVAQRNFFIDKWREKSVKRKIFKLCNFLLVKLQMAFGIDKFKSENIKLCYGQPWWSLSEDAVRVVLSKKDWILSKFSKGSFGADEVALQTVIYNSSLKDTLYQDSEGHFVNLMKLDFIRGNGMGSPYVWKTKDYNELMSSECMFARKFDASVDEKIIKMISMKIIEER